MANKTTPKDPEQPAERSNNLPKLNEVLPADPVPVVVQGTPVVALGEGGETRTVEGDIGQTEMQRRAEAERLHGVRGTKVDPIPDHAYTVAGQLLPDPIPTPRIAPGPAEQVAVETEAIDRSLAETGTDPSTPDPVTGAPPHNPSEAVDHATGAAAGLVDPSLRTEAP